MTEQTYNGWTNYETWNVNLWLTNDSGGYEYWMEQAAEHFHGADGEDAADSAEIAKNTLADQLEDEHNEARPEVHGVFADLLGAALSEVNWREIAEHLVTDSLEAIQS